MRASVRFGRQHSTIVALATERWAAARHLLLFLTKVFITLIFAFSLHMKYFDLIKRLFQFFFLIFFLLTLLL